MSALEWMQPRHHRAGARAFGALSGVAGATALVTVPLAEQSMGAGSTLLLLALLGVAVGIGVLFDRLSRTRYPANSPRWVWAAVPLSSVGAIVVTDLLTDDASLAGQLFFLFPALYGASQLRPRGAAMMAGASVAGQIVVVATLLPWREAVIDVAYMSAGIITTSILLTIANERHAQVVAHLEDLAAIDPLTGLATRRVLDEAAGSALSGAGSEAGTALILLDIDHFKKINDRFGHPAGDAVLVTLAAVLIDNTRPSDVVCRLGGDEIAILLPACGRADAVRRAEQILTAVREHTFSTEEGVELPVSTSIGCAHLPTHAVDLRTLYNAADAALYEAKQAGRGRVVAAPDERR